MLSKEAGVVGLALVAVHDWFLEADRGRLFRNQRAAGLYVAYLLTFLVYLLVRTTVAGGIGVAETSFLDNPLVAAGPGARLGTAIVVVGRGVALLAAPLTLSPDYSYDAIPVVRSLLDLRLVATVVALGVLGWMLATRRVRSPAVSIGVLWYAFALFPTSNLLLPVGTIFAERLLYLPSVAACLLAAAGLAWVTRNSRRVALAAAFAAVLGLAIQTWRYSSAWTDNTSLFRWAVASVPRSTKAHHKLGEDLIWAGHLGEGLQELDRSLAIAPENKYAASTWAVAERFIADRYAQGGEDAVDPPTDPDVLSVLAKLSGDRGDFAQAERYWQAALSLDPLHSHSLAGMGLMHLLKSDTTGAIRYLQLAVAQELPPANAWFNLGRIHLARGENWLAARALRQFVALAGSRYPTQVQWAEGALATLTQ
jgi:tetratricopeptide (TPR) repeat protein